MKNLIGTLLLAAIAAAPTLADEITVNFSELGLDNGSGMSEVKINDNLTISSIGNASWNDSNGDFRLFSGGGLTVNVTDATLTQVSIVCNSGRGFGPFSTVTADSESAEFTADPFLWRGEATESWTVTASPSNLNVRMESITFVYTPKAVSTTCTAEFLCKDMGVEDGSAMQAGGYDANEHINIDFAQGTHAAVPTYLASSEAFRLFNGQQVVVSAKNNAKIIKIEIATTSANTFGYGGTVTADGELQTYDTNYTWVPCEWNGSAEQSVVFTNGGKTGNTRVTGVSVTYITPGDELVVARPEIVQSETDNSVTITCSTEGAQIYYTVDGKDPVEADENLYTDSFTLTAACTVRAIAVKDGVSSSVSSIEAYLRIVDSLAEFLRNQSPEPVKIECPVTSIVKVGSYLMVKDDKGSFAIIRNYDSSLDEELDVENGTTWSEMTATFDAYGDYGYLQPVSLGEVSHGDPVQPRLMTIDDFDCVPFEYVTLKNVSVSATGSYSLTFTDKDGQELDGYNRFVITMPDMDDPTASYVVTGFASNTGEELWPVSFTRDTNAGVASIDSSISAPIYYNLRGIRIETPISGSAGVIVIDGKAKKVIFE